MKVSYDVNGKILAVAVSTVNLGGTIINVPDNQDLLMRPNAYQVNIANLTIVRRPYLKMTASATSPLGSAINVSIQRFNGDTTPDTSSTELVKVISTGIFWGGRVDIVPESFNLVNGAGSFSLSSTQKGRVSVITQSEVSYQDFLQVEFV